MRGLLVTCGWLAGVGLGAGVARAQPADPYGPTAPAAPATDPVLAEQIAQSIIARAQELYDARQLADARRLAREALAQSPGGAAARQAALLIAAVDRQIGPEKATPRPPPAPAPAPTPTPGPGPGPTPVPRPTDTSLAPVTPVAPGTPVGPAITTPRDPNLPDVGELGPGIAPPPPLPPPSSVPPAGLPLPPIHNSDNRTPPDHATRHARIAMSVHAALYGGLLGTTVGSATSDYGAGRAVTLGIVTGAAAGLLMPLTVPRLGWSAAQIRTAGSLSAWGGVIGGFGGDLAESDGTGASAVLVGASLGATLGLATGIGIAKSNKRTSGDVALVDTLAGIGTIGGLTVGMLMQPAQGEAYSLNAALGGAAGVVVGLVAGPETNTTPRRMLRVAGLAAIGGAAPFLLYGAIRDESTSADERTVGALATVGLVAGAWVGFRLTRGLDSHQDVKSGDTGADDAPVSVLGRSSDGAWALGGLGLAPLDPRLAPQRGMTLSLVGATF